MHPMRTGVSAEDYLSSYGLPSAEAVAAAGSLLAAGAMLNGPGYPQSTVFRPHGDCSPSPFHQVRTDESGLPPPPAYAYAPRPDGPSSISELSSVVDAMIDEPPLPQAQVLQMPPAQSPQPPQPPRKRGRPPGSKNKMPAPLGPPKMRKGRSHDDDWCQGKYLLRPNVHMVCLAGIDKETGIASKGCGMVLPAENVRWVAAKKVRAVEDGCPCAVIWTHGGRPC